MSFYTPVTLAGVAFNLGAVPLKTVAEAVQSTTAADLDQLRCTFTWAKGRVAQVEQNIALAKGKNNKAKLKAAKALLASIEAKGLELNGSAPATVEAVQAEPEPKAQQTKVEQYVDMGMNKLQGLINSGVTKNPVLIEAQGEAMSYFVDTAPIQVTKLNEAEQSFARLIDAALEMGIDINKVLASR